MSETSPTLGEQLLTLTRQFQAQARATEKLTRDLEQVKAEAAEEKKAAAVTKKALETKVTQQGERIELLEGEVEGLKETSSSSSSITAARPSEPVQTGKFVRRWRIVFVLGALVPHGFALGRL